MRATTLKQVAQWCSGSVDPKWENVEITSLCHDSREAEPGTLFFALEGQVDGHRYVPAARDNGAAAAVCNHPLELDFPQVIVEDTRKALRDVRPPIRRRLAAKLWQLREAWARPPRAP